ncbi:MAG: sodium:calcium antiporter [Candidatus Micrarchaeota archaeon]
MVLEILLPLAYVLGGMLVIFKSAEKSTENAVILARVLGISELAIGFILVSTATSMPEFAVAISAALRSSASVADSGTNLAVGNIFGANLADILWVIGVAAALGVVAVKRKDIRELTMVLLASSAISMLFVIYRPNRISGGLLFVIFLAYVFWLLRREKKIKVARTIKKPNEFLLPLVKFGLFISVVIIFAQIVVDNAIYLSKMFGVTSTVIGGTIIAFGTTLPELSVTIAAVRKKAEKVALGNAIGSGIVNLTLIFGTALMINPAVEVASASKLIVFSVLANLLLLYFIMIRRGIGKREGYLMMAGYIAFLIIFGLGSL